MSLQPPESSLFAQLEDTSPVGVASEMFFDATKDYLSAISVGLSVSKEGRTQACQDVGYKANRMGSVIQMLAVKLYEDNPDTAPARLASALFTNECMQYTELKSHLTSPGIYYEDEEVFLGSLNTSLGILRTMGEPAQEALTQVAKDVLLLNTHVWMRTLRNFGVTKN
jgi:hypothetical protein